MKQMIKLADTHSVALEKISEGTSSDLDSLWKTLLCSGLQHYRDAPNNLYGPNSGSEAKQPQVHAFGMV